MSHHQKEFGCACCSPIWKNLMPNYQPVKKDLPDQKQISNTLIFQAKDGGTILTLEGGKEITTEALGIKNGKIFCTGNLDEVKKNLPKEVEVIHITGTQILMPSFIEPHVHILPSAVMNTGIDVGPFIEQSLRTNMAEESNTPEEIYTVKWVIEKLKNHRPAEPFNSDRGGPWIFGRNMDPSLLIGEKEFNAGILDEATEEWPIFLMNSSLHIAYLNSLAITYLNKTHGLKINKDGILREMAEIQPVMELLPGPSENLFLQELKKVFETAVELGTTYLFDAGVEAPASENDPLNQIKILKYLAETNGKVRIGGALIATSLTDLNQIVLKNYEPNKGNEKFNLAFVKLLPDGSNQGLTAYQYLPYNCDENYVNFNLNNPDGLAKQTNTGIFNYGYPLEFNQLVKQVYNFGWPVMIHANGTQTMDRTIEAFKAAGYSTQNKNLRRDRIEHCSLLTDKNLEDMAQLGISPSFLIGHVGYWGWAFQQSIFGPETTNLLDRCRSAIVKHGMRITLHSDYGVTPLGPLRMMEQSITRLMEDAPKNKRPIQLNEPETITPFQALKSMTYDAAWQCHADQWVGSLEVGKCADFVILAESPLSFKNGESGYSSQGMRDITVISTWKDGLKVYEKTNFNEDKVKKSKKDRAL